MLEFPVGAALALQAQDDPFETQIYNVEFLTREVQDRPGTDFSLSSDTIGTAIAVSEFSKCRLTGEDLALFLRARANLLEK